MEPDLPFSCQCGIVTGTIARAGPRQGDHVVCHCSDCQALTRHLGHDKRVLDRNGGTALYQSRCASLRVTSGLDKLACLHMTEGPILRWYAACCRAPLFNTWKTGRIPFVTTHLSACDPGHVAKALGPPIGHLYLADATGDPAGLQELKRSALMRRFLVRMVKDILAGHRRRSPLFDPKTLAPIAVPDRLTRDQRQALG